MKIIHKDILDSTNTYAEQLVSDGKISKPTCVTAGYQSSGQGRNAGRWESEAEKNLTFSIVCFPEFLSAGRQFYLNKVASLSVHQLIQQMLPEQEIRIKWPNDIYIADKKVAGILIKVNIQNNIIKHAVIGIGININQEKFPDDLPNPVSVIQHKKKSAGLDLVLNNYLAIFQRCFAMLENNEYDKIDPGYLNALYRYKEQSLFEIAGKKVYASITGVDEYGWLQLVCNDGKILSGDMNKVKMILSSKSKI
ncbi:MAG TPA: biotin--[acetyl-CoA-carboxylase] ligase [Bacteroidales bacterium]|nr:biotin--[acetyl-CoA-carboxylase] ligase [Bacteroidales bacterium]